MARKTGWKHRRHLAAKAGFPPKGQLQTPSIGYATILLPW